MVLIATTPLFKVLTARVHGQSDNRLITIVTERRGPLKYGYRW
jgi:hypothetical protein